MVRKSVDERFHGGELIFIGWRFRFRVTVRRHDDLQGREREERRSFLPSAKRLSDGTRVERRTSLSGTQVLSRLISKRETFQWRKTTQLGTTYADFDRAERNRLSEETNPSR